MRFSFVIPVYGTERYLPRCLDSIRAQTSGDFEVIVVDDCSPGGKVSQIVAGYDARFRCIVHEKNRSAFQSRCTGAAAAQGEYVIPVDPDDYILPELLAKVGESLDVCQPDMISYWMDYDRGGRVVPHWCRHPACEISAREALHELADMKFFTGVASKILKRSTLIVALERLSASSDLYVNTSDDFLMLVPFLLCSARVVFLPYAGYRYFVNTASTSFSWRDEKGFEAACSQTEAVLRLVSDMAIREGVDKDLRQAIATAAASIERFFVRAGLDASLANGMDVGPVVMRHFQSEQVAHEALAYVREMGGSRAFALSRVLARIMRPFRLGGVV